MGELGLGAASRLGLALEQLAQRPSEPMEQLVA